MINLGVLSLITTFILMLGSLVLFIQLIRISFLAINALNIYINKNRNSTPPSN